MFKDHLRGRYKSLSIHIDDLFIWSSHTGQSSIHML
jgi:hypothetical protein